MLQLRRDGMISCAFDVFIAFIGGNHIQIVHRFETIFFGSLFVASIFMGILGPQAIFYLSFINADESFDSFVKLTMQNPPIFISPALKQYEEIIIEMLRCVVGTILTAIKTNCFVFLIKNIFSNKIGKDMNYAGKDNYMNIIHNHNLSFAYVAEESAAHHLRFMSVNLRDSDILTENLGDVISI